MHYDTIIVGGGIAGLTSAAFLCKSGHNVLLCEKEDRLGGLIGSFDYKGFTFDAGIRATEDSGVLFPMLKSLGIEIEFLDNKVSMGLEDYIIDIVSKTSVNDYQEMLEAKFEENKEAISKIIETIRKIMDYMDILYGIDNPLFLDFKKDREYLIKTIVPWLFKYISTVGKIKKYDMSVEEYLETITDNKVLIDIIAQHFFKSTPSFFALSYFSLYLDYKYPRGGTGSLISALTDYIEAHGGNLQTNTSIKIIDISNQKVEDQDGNTYGYKTLVWAADLKTLYDIVTIEGSVDQKTKKAISEKKTLLSDKKGGDSVLTTYLTVDLDKEYFEKKHGAHFFYTPELKGLSKASIKNIIDFNGNFVEDKETVLDWIAKYIRLNTFEISIPVIRDETLAPKGKTGLIISVLIDYDLVKHIEEKGWYDEFKNICEKTTIEALTVSVYPELKDKVLDGFVSTPLTIFERTGNTDGAITGWAFTNDTMPAVKSMPKIASSVKTPLPNIVQSGQWTYSPSGLPISILTGKLAADKINKKLKSGNKI